MQTTNSSINSRILDLYIFPCIAPLRSPQIHHSLSLSQTLFKDQLVTLLRETGAHNLLMSLPFLAFLSKYALSEEINDLVSIDRLQEVVASGSDLDPELSV